MSDDQNPTIELWCRSCGAVFTPPQKCDCERAGMSELANHTPQNPTTEGRFPPPRCWTTDAEKEAWSAHYAEVLRLYKERGMSKQEIADLYGRHVSSVQDWLLRAGVHRKQGVFPVVSPPKSDAMSEDQKATNPTTKQRWEIILRFEGTEEQAAEVGRRVSRILQNAGVTLGPTPDAAAMMEFHHDR